MTYRFSGFRVDAVRRLLFGADDEPIPLKPRVFDTLLYLVEHRGELLDKRTLLEAIWPNVIVEENNLNQAISTLRRVLGETRDEHRFIVTEPGRGYRFVAGVETVPAGTAEQPPARAEPTVLSDGNAALSPTSIHQRASAPGHSQSKRPRLVLASAAIAAACALAGMGVYWLARDRTESADTFVPAPPPNSVAVLPFSNLSPDPGDAYFAVGIHEEILSQLTKLGALHVASRTSVQSYAGTQKSTPAIARELNVETVLDGSVRYADGHVVLTVHLNDGTTNGLLWSQSYEREFSNIFTIQSDIALSVARALRAKLLPVESERVTRVPTTSLRAYDLYLSATARGRRETRAEQLLAIEEVEQALALDPDFALAWVLISRLRTTAQYYDSERGAEHRSLGEQAARRALELDPSLGLAHAALGFALSTRRDFTAAEAAYRKALDLNVPLGDPNGYGVLQLSVANFGYAHEIGHEVRGIVPEEQTALRFGVMTNALLGDWPAAVAQYDLGMRLFAPWREAENLMRHLRIGRNELVEARAIPTADPINAAMIANLDSPVAALSELRRLYAVTARENANGLRTIALWAGHFDDAALALDAMRAAVTEQGGQAVYLWLPQLKQMRQLPEFKAFLRDIGIVAYWQKYGWPDICRRSGRDDFDCD